MSWKSASSIKSTAKYNYVHGSKLILLNSSLSLLLLKFMICMKKFIIRCVTYDCYNKVGRTHKHIIHTSTLMYMRMHIKIIISQVEFAYEL